MVHLYDASGHRRSADRRSERAERAGRAGRASEPIERAAVRASARASERARPIGGPSERESERAEICRGKVWFICVLRLGEGGQDQTSNRASRLPAP